MDIYNTPIIRLPNVAEKRAVLLKKLNIIDIYSLITHYPREYVDYTDINSISACVLQQNNVFSGSVIRKLGTIMLKNKLTISKLLVSDDSDTITVTYFNNQYMYDTIKLHENYIFYGKVVSNQNGIECTSPTHILESAENKILPIYPLTHGISNKILGNLIKLALDNYQMEIQEFLPDDIRMENKLSTINFAINNIHFPTEKKAFDIAKYRLAFNELLLLQLGLLKLKSNNNLSTAVNIIDTNIYEFYKQLSFTLTNAQQKVINECLQDITLKVPMNRLVQGDVGSGKTMVGIALAFCMYKNNYQSIIMAPTEILAMQHYKTFNDILEKLGVRCCLLTGSSTKKQKNEIYKMIKNGEIDIVIGTHAVISDAVEYKNLGLVITDEQHRFGVNQRAKLQKKGEYPHTLVMSATPIPRTLALIIYGDLEISIIDEMPKGRQEIETYALNHGKRARAMGLAKKQVDLGKQVYIVCPAVEDSQSGLFSVVEYEKQLKSTFLGEYRMAVLHGKLKSKEKDEIMLSFKNKEIDILISTTVVEVGVDVPNATLMIIENAERFGLSALHQLRGRVGRGKDKSYCILISENVENNKRLKIMCDTTDGFVIAREDLKLRGPGDFFGNKQHGLPLLKLSNMMTDIELVHLTGVVAKKILSEDALLSSDKYKLLSDEVDRLFNNNEQDVYN